MKTILICGYFARENESEIQAAARKPVEYSSNNYIRTLIQGFHTANDEVIVLSAPLIGSYPNASKILNFRGFKTEQQECQYVNFINLWGYRNFSRANSLKKAIKKIFDENTNVTFRIVVCSVHTPFIECAAYAKRLRPNTKVCLIVPDLPQYMNLDADVSFIYKAAKSLDIRRFQKLNRCVDFYILLTEQMKEKIDVHGCDYLVAEGLIKDCEFDNVRSVTPKESNGTINIVYTGKTYEKFGIKNLVQAFMRIKENNYRLIICGAGDSDAYIQEQAEHDKRIVFLGQVTSAEAKKWINNAKVLVNPRQNNEEYTKYSFPSKNLEYLASGKVVVLYMLDGMKEEYANFCIIPKDNTVEALSDAIVKAANLVNFDGYEKFTKYSKTLFASEICKTIVQSLK